ncbi:GntR family transcriptional regulator [Tuberibacillus calidus]|jgi:GntR family transcriptional regulator|uniref:GntR family transcriptional regulator n=1 Tax=Tuberibacillus calidus TaxID=340097 RepID=UPI0003F654D5|nr:GntR family transcriptional regulator [Tuberibacillus calidus]
MTDSFDPSAPIYLQLLERIQRQILRGDLKPGDKLPSVREMAIHSGVNPNTVQRTYREMEAIGIVETRRGQGTFVTEKEAILQSMRETLKNKEISRFVEGMKAMGYTHEEILTGLSIYLSGVKGSDQE